MSRLCALILSFFALCGPALAQGTPTEEDVKTLTLQAANYIATNGIDAASAAFTQEGPFKYGEIYVNVIDFNGNWVIYPPKPENKGKNVLNFIDEDGKKLGQEILDTGKAGEGWTTYRWKNPATNLIQPKVTYVKRVPNQEYIAYVGIYK
ncbi:cache domain-containing protein [Pararhodospirillum photometricum]|nr:cache domain-containing protein [Pararhodospirillum photometricum]